MNKSDQNKFERLASFFHHELNDANDARQIQEESGITEDPDFRAVKKIYELKDLVYQAGKITHRAKVWHKVHARMRRRYLMRNIVYWQYAAAVIAVTLVIGFVANSNIRQYFSDKEQLVSVVSPMDGIKALKLPDGTDVWLNYGSVLKYSNRFGKANRDVIIEGEAFFEVVKEAKNSFTVTLGNSKVIVHGTTFNVKAYSSDDKYEVILVEGSVEYVNSQKNIFIEAGERISESRSSRELIVDQVDTEKYTSWKSGKAYFDNETLFDLITLLEKWYDVEFEFTSDDAKSYTFTGVINREQTLDYTLKIIEMTNKVKFVKKGGKMLITN